MNYQYFQPTGFWCRCYDGHFNGRYFISMYCLGPVYMNSDRLAVVNDFGDLVGVGK